MFKKIRFKDIYIQTYYFLSTVEYLPNNNKGIIGAKNNILMFENHINDFFEYTGRQTQANKNDPFSQNFFSIPATSIASEQAFSCTDHIINNSHTLLDPDT
ncbi:19169_t:CDS:2, partial [Dentiscutata erythropus]